MVNSPKITLFNNLDDLDLHFEEGENELEFEIDDYSFVISYSLEADDIFIEDDESVRGANKLKILSINAYDNVEDEDIEVNVDDDLQVLFSNYYIRTMADDNFEPLNISFGEFSDFIGDR